MSYKTLKGKYTISPQKQASMFRSCEYKGKKVIDGHNYYLVEEALLKATIMAWARGYQDKGYKTHVEKSKYYSGWNLWARRK